MDMTGTPWMRLMPWIVFAVAAVTLFAVGGLRARRRARDRAPAPPTIPNDGRTAMMSLKSAATEVYEIARRERMVVVTVVEAPGTNAVEWFARSMSRVVPVFRRGAADAYEKIAASGNEDLDALYIRKQDLQTYVRWVRPMQ